MNLSCCITHQLSVGQRTEASAFVRQADTRDAHQRYVGLKKTAVPPRVSADSFSDELKTSKGDATRASAV
jgi:hypothetical protein